MDKPLGVDPARRMIADAELAGAVGDHDRALHQPQVTDRAPQGALGRQGDGIGRHGSVGKAERLQMRRKGRRIGELCLSGALKRRKRRLRQAAPAHIVEGGGRLDREFNWERHRLYRQLDEALRELNWERHRRLNRVYGERDRRVRWLRSKR